MSCVYICACVICACCLLLSLVYGVRSVWDELAGASSERSTVLGPRCGCLTLPLGDLRLSVKCLSCSAHASEQSACERRCRHPCAALMRGGSLLCCHERFYCIWPLYVADRASCNVATMSTAQGFVFRSNLGTFIVDNVEAQLRSHTICHLIHRSDYHHSKCPVPCTLPLTLVRLVRELSTSQCLESATCSPSLITCVGQQCSYMYVRPPRGAIYSVSVCTKSGRNAHRSINCSKS